MSPRSQKPVVRKRQTRAERLAALVEEVIRRHPTPPRSMADKRPPLDDAAAVRRYILKRLKRRKR